MAQDHPLADLDITRVTATQLWQACLMFTVIDNLDALAEGDYDPLHSPDTFGDGPQWEAEGRSFRFDHGSDQGTLWFEGDEIIGAFFEHEDDDRSPYAEGENLTFDYRDVWNGMPDYLWPIAEREIVPRMTVEDMAPQPGISAGLWSEGGYLRTAEPWPEVVEHGAWILADVLKAEDATDNFEAVLTEWATDRELSESQIAAIRSYFSRRIATSREQPVYMTDEEIELAGD